MLDHQKSTDHNTLQDPSIPQGTRFVGGQNSQIPKKYMGFKDFLILPNLQITGTSQGFRQKILNFLRET